MSINDLVSYNLARARKEHGWTQDELAEKLRKETGRDSWTNVTVSAAERAHVTGRPRLFDADLLVALAKVFDKPVTYFLSPSAELSDAETLFTTQSTASRNNEAHDSAPTISSETLQRLTTEGETRYESFDDLIQQKVIRHIIKDLEDQVLEKLRNFHIVFSSPDEDHQESAIKHVDLVPFIPHETQVDTPRRTDPLEQAERAVGRSRGSGTEPTDR